MINTSKDDVLKLFTNEELASILELMYSGVAISPCDIIQGLTPWGGW